MVPISALWIPILVAALLVFVVSSVIHMFLTYHRSDYQAVPKEDEVMDALRNAVIPPGDYVLPHASEPKAMGSPEFLEKATKGPVAFLTVVPSGPPKMGKNLVQWFLYSVVVGIFVAYIAGRTLTSGADYMTVFRLTGTAAFLAYSVALAQNSIWFGRAWSATLKSSFDGLVYALLTAAAFGWLWPG